MESIKVKDYMNKRPVVFSAAMPLSSALEKMLNAQQIGGPVLDEQDNLVGFLSEQDMLHKLLKAGYHCQETDTVAESMHVDVLAVDENDSILQLAEEMLPNKPKIYPVLDSKKRLVGTISRRDILKAIAAQIENCFSHQL